MTEYAVVIVSGDMHHEETERANVVAISAGGGHNTVRRDLTIWAARRVTRTLNTLEPIRAQIEELMRTCE